RRRLGAGVDHLRLVRASGEDLPDALERGAGVLGEAQGRGFGRGPAAAEVVAGGEHRTPVLAPGPRQQPPPPVARVVGEGVHGLAGEVGPAHLPARARRGGAEQEGTLHGANQQHDVTVPDLDLAGVDHEGSPEGGEWLRPARGEPKVASRGGAGKRRRALSAPGAYGYAAAAIVTVEPSGPSHGS